MIPKSFCTNCGETYEADEDNVCKCEVCGLRTDIFAYEGPCNDSEIQEARLRFMAKNPGIEFDSWPECNELIHEDRQ